MPTTTDDTTTDDTTTTKTADDRLDWLSMSLDDIACTAKDHWMAEWITYRVLRSHGLTDEQANKHSKRLASGGRHVNQHSSNVLLKPAIADAVEDVRVANMSGAESLARNVPAGR